MPLHGLTSIRERFSLAILTPLRDPIFYRVGHAAVRIGLRLIDRRRLGRRSIPFYYLYFLFTHLVEIGGGRGRPPAILLLLVVNEAAGAVAKCDIYLLPVKYGGHLAMAEDAVHHSLAAPILSCAVIWRRSAARSDRDGGFNATCLSAVYQGYLRVKMIISISRFQRIEERS